MFVEKDGVGSSLILVIGTKVSLTHSCPGIYSRQATSFHICVIKPK